MDKIEEAIIEHWGERCSEFDDGCPCCQAWKEYDEVLALDRDQKNMWNINMKAIREWHKAHPDRDTTWPDYKKLLLWLMKENERLRIAMVQSVLPLEAMLLVGNTQLKLAPELWEGIEKGVAAVRTTLGEKES